MISTKISKFSYFVSSATYRRFKHKSAYKRSATEARWEDTYFKVQYY